MERQDYCGVGVSRPLFNVSESYAAGLENDAVPAALVSGWATQIPSSNSVTNFVPAACEAVRISLRGGS
jgi:hypothetical protein